METDGLLKAVTYIVKRVISRKLCKVQKMVNVLRNSVPG